MTGRTRTILSSTDPERLACGRRAVEAGGGTVVIAAVATWREAAALASHYGPEVLLLDAGAGAGDARPDVLEPLAARRPETRVVVLCPADEEELALELLRRGAWVVERGTGARALPRVVAAVLAGEPLVPRLLVARLVDAFRAHPAGGRGLRPVRSALTPREWEVLDALCAGGGTREIADALSISVETVRSHLKSTMRKLGVESRAAAIDVATELRSGGGVPVAA